MGSAVRYWLTFPKDTPTAYYYTRAVDDGLNIPMLENATSLAKQSRIACLAESQDHVVSAMINKPMALTLLRTKQTTLDSSFVATVF